ncbi:hypothetical protein [Larkinella arboricola]|uniref:hypothetical protein n=1 Tax=Larkinella arboricola TaxID=643671 RepID=UPI000DB95D36|nr:hypothetical protein [Larkinella arboricola]
MSNGQKIQGWNGFTKWLLIVALFCGLFLFSGSHDSVLAGTRTKTEWSVLSRFAVSESVDGAESSTSGQSVQAKNTLDRFAFGLNTLFAYNRLVKTKLTVLSKFVAFQKFVPHFLRLKTIPQGPVDEPVTFCQK